MKWTLFLSFMAVQITLVAQELEVGLIDYYGLSTPGAPAKTKVDACLAFKVGTLISKETKNVWKDPSITCLKKLPGIKQATVEGICCDDKNRVMIFVGLSNKSAPVHKQGSFSKDIRLPESIIAANDTLESGILSAIQTGEAGEDDSNGHALFHFPKAAEPQKLFAAYAATNLSTLRDVLHHSRHEKDRAVACWVIAFNPDKKGIVADLSTAVNDPSEGVRNNAIRALAIIDNYLRQIQVDVRIDPAPFIELMNSISWSDRNKSANILTSLTWRREPELMAKLKREALYPLADMARWKSTGHAMAAFTILGRMAGWKDEVIAQRVNEDRNKWVDELLIAIGKP